MQQELFEHGIGGEQSDIRIHVSGATRRLFIFQTAAAQEFLKKNGNKFKERLACQPDVQYATAKGTIVPCHEMPTLRVVELSADDWWEKFHPDLTTSEKGFRAARLVERALREGLVPLPYLFVTESKNLNVQRSGTDIQVWGYHRIQVKCDWKAGPKAWGGTGHFYIQNAERNPRKRY